MARRAFRISYIGEDGRASAQTVFYGDSAVSAREYAEGLFDFEEQGTISVMELASDDVGVPDDEVLREWADQQPTGQDLDHMRSPGNVNG